MAIEPSLISSLTWFAHVARHRSFTKAASEMGVTRAALSQHVKGLEKQLQVRLLNRTTRNMSLTEEGQRLLDTLHPSLSYIEQALNSLNDLQRGSFVLACLEQPLGFLSSRTWGSFYLVIRKYV